MNYFKVFRLWIFVTSFIQLTFEAFQCRRFSNYESKEFQSLRVDGKEEFCMSNCASGWYIKIVHVT